MSSKSAVRIHPKKGTWRDVKGKRSLSLSEDLVLASENIISFPALGLCYYVVCHKKHMIKSYLYIVLLYYKYQER